MIGLLTCACGMFEYTSCGLFDPRFCSPDPFYQSSGEIDCLRVPLLEPYEAIKIDDTGWYIDLNPESLKEEFCIGINDAKEIAIIDARIYVYSDYIRPEGNNIEIKSFHWFVIDVGNNTEMVFKTEDEFQQYLKNNGDITPEWMALDDAFKEFEQTGCLAWVPGCDEE